MIDELSGGKLTINNKCLLVSAAQKTALEEFLRKNACSAEWFPSVSNVEPYSSVDSESAGVAVWSVFLTTEDPSGLQSELDKAE